MKTHSVTYLLSPEVELFADQLEQLWVTERQEVYNFIDPTQKLVPPVMSLGRNRRINNRSISLLQYTAVEKQIVQLQHFSVNTICLWNWVTFRIGRITDSLNCREILMSSLFWTSSGEQHQHSFHVWFHSPDLLVTWWLYVFTVLQQITTVCVNVFAISQMLIPNKIKKYINYSLRHCDSSRLQI